jgi:hypothetical protein
MNKKVTIFAVILIAIGIIGTISSSVAAVPFVTNYVNETLKKANEEVKIYEKKVDINKLNIETNNVNVELRKSNSDKIIIKQIGSFNKKVFTIDNNNKEFTIKENKDNQHIDIQVQGFGDAVLSMLGHGYNKIIIYVPNSIEVQAKTNSADLILDDKDVLLNKVEFSTSYGQIILPTENKSLESLKISSMDNVNLTVREFLGIKNVNISTQSNVYIKSTPDDVFVDNIESFIPDSINIIADRASSVDIQSNIPVAKNLNIDNKSGDVFLDLPIDYYNIYFNLNASQGLSFNNENQNSDNNKLMNKFEGNLRDPKENEFKYNVYVKSDNINLVKK